MKAKDLRIGNYILSHDKTEFEVRSINDHKHGLSCLDIKTKEGFCVTAEYASGIPLTEEWLIKLGFELKTRSPYYSNYFLNGFYISMYTHIKPVAGFEETGVCYWGDEYLPVRFVHKLQNLYNAATDGLELEVKL